MRCRGGHQQNPVLWPQNAVDDTNQHHDANIVVKPGIDYQSLERLGLITSRCRHSGNDRFEHIVDSLAGLRAGQHRVGRIDTDHVFDFLSRPVSICRRQIDLVEHRDDFDPLLNCGVAIGDSLCFDALGRIDHKQGTLACGKRAADFVREIDVPWRIDQVEIVGLAIPRPVRQGRRLRLDGNAALALEIHRVEHLLLHLAIGKSAAALDQSIGQRRFAVIDMRDDGEIAYVLHQKERAEKRVRPSGGMSAHPVAHPLGNEATECLKEAGF